jgi:hypothetical protein
MPRKDALHRIIKLRQRFVRSAMEDMYDEAASTKTIMGLGFSIYFRNSLDYCSSGYGEAKRKNQRINGSTCNDYRFTTTNNTDESERQLKKLYKLMN